MTTNNTWPGKPGVPMNPEKDGCHWLYNKRLGKECDFKECAFWTGAGEFWRMMGAEECFSPIDLVVREWTYLGPCLTPDQATALQARVAELEGAQARLILSFRLNILRLKPQLSHETISKAIEVALEGKKDV